MSENVNYTQLEIVRYLQKKMTPKEMHDFEKVMMQDPLLMDAVEGYTNASLSISQNHLSEIEAEILGGKKTIVVVPQPVANQQWWKVAAILVLMVGGSAIAYQWMSNSSENNLATIQEDTKAPEADSFKPADKPAPATEIFDRPSAVALAKKPSNPPFVSSSADNELTAMQEDSKKRKETTNTLLAPEASITASIGADENLSSMKAQARLAGVEKKPASDTGFTFKGVVTDTAGEPVAFATLLTKWKTLAVSDGDGQFLIKAPDSLVLVDVLSVGYIPVKKKLSSTSSNNTIILSLDKESLSEIVVTGVRGRKKGLVNNYTTTLPKKGWKDYKRYVDREIEALIDTSENYESGTVELSFNVDNTGTPVNITITNSTAPFNDDIAIRLLQKGPKWKQRDKMKKGILVIQF